MHQTETPRCTERCADAIAQGTRGTRFERYMPQSIRTRDLKGLKKSLLSNEHGEAEQAHSPETADVEARTAQPADVDAGERGTVDDHAADEGPHAHPIVQDGVAEFAQGEAALYVPLHDEEAPPPTLQTSQSLPAAGRAGAGGCTLGARSNFLASTL